MNALSLLKLLPARSTLAGGLGGVAAWLITLILAHFGIIVSPDVVTGAVIAVSTLLVHVVPDSAKDIAGQLNVDVQKLATIVPEIQYTYPDGNK